MKTTTTSEAFKTDFNINTDTTDITFKEINVEPYDSLPQNHQFGEKICLLYRVNLILFNIKITLRILTFKYNYHAEVLKLEIKIYDETLLKEIAPCKNFLQRKRNINSALELLIKFTRLFETRRLICMTVFEKQPNVVVMSDDGIIVKCCNDNFSIKYLELNWSIIWKLEHYEVGDFIEFYLNYKALDANLVNQVKKRLAILVEPDADFQVKLKLWKLVMQDLYGCVPTVRKSRHTAGKSTDILEISDSDSDDSVIEIDKTVSSSPGGDEIMVID